MSRAKLLTVLVLLICIHTACQPSMVLEETPLPSATPTLSPSNTPFPTATWTPTPPAPPTVTTDVFPELTETPIPLSTEPQEPELIALVGADDGIVIGGLALADGSWIPADLSVDLTIQQPLHVHAGDNYLGETSIVTETQHPLCPVKRAVSFTSEPAMEYALAVSAAPWELQPVSPQWLDISPGGKYFDVAAAWLIEQGIEQPQVEITALMLIDLDGDGTDEVLVNASRLSRPPGSASVAAGDYSFVMVRKLSGNEVVTIPLVADIYLTDQSGFSPWRYRLNNVLDLNGDGQLEIIIDAIRHETGQTFVYTLDGSNPFLMLHTACRAFDRDTPATPAATFTPTLPPEPTPTYLPQSAEPGKVYALVANGGYLLGGVRDGKWLAKEATGTSVQAGESYQKFGHMQYLGQDIGGAPFIAGTDQDDDFIPEVGICEGLWMMNFNEGFGNIAVGGPWQALPRVPMPILPEDAFIEALKPLLRENGVGYAPVAITSAWRIDLEGDGVEEIVIAANHPERYKWPKAEATNYNLVAVLRPKEDGQFSVIPLANDYYLTDTDVIYPDTYRVAAILDLNGDGKMEVIVRGTHWDGSQTLVYEITGNSGKLVLGVGCSWTKGNISHDPP